MATPSQMPPAPRTSTTAMAGMIAMVAIIFGVIFGYIAMAPSPPWTTTGRLWWIGFVGLVFAFVSYLVYAGTDARPIRLLSGGLFIVSMGSFYGAILTGDPNQVLLWLVVLSVFLLIILAFIFVMARQAEATRIRASQRKLTP